MFKQQHNDFQVKFYLQKYVLYISCQVWKIHWQFPSNKGCNSMDK